VGFAEEQRLEDEDDAWDDDDGGLEAWKDDDGGLDHSGWQAAHEEWKDHEVWEDAPDDVWDPDEGV
jgi:hypothetical protein